MTVSGEELSAQWEGGNVHDKHAVVVIKDNCIVRHILVPCLETHHLFKTWHLFVVSTSLHLACMAIAYLRKVFV